jgi:very-short-patch-repair endonuclease
LTKLLWLTDKVEVVPVPAATVASPEVGYDLVWPIGQGDRAQWMHEIDVIYLPGVPRALRRGARVYLMQGRDIFWSAPVEEVVSDEVRISDVSGADHGAGPNLIVDLTRGKRHRIDATRVPTPDGESWHARRGMKYVTPGCREFVRIGPKPPNHAWKSRSSTEIALERSLSARGLKVEPKSRRLSIRDGLPRPTVEVDICIPDIGVVVEFDGRWWHQGREAQDRAKSQRLRDAGLRVIRVRDALDPLDERWDVRVDAVRQTSDDLATEVIRVLRRRRVSVSPASLA